MLKRLDKEFKARVPNFVRYADKCVIFVKSEKAAICSRSIINLLSIMTG